MKVSEFDKEKKYYWMDANVLYTSHYPRWIWMGDKMPKKFGDEEIVYATVGELENSEPTFAVLQNGSGNELMLAIFE